MAITDPTQIAPKVTTFDPFQGVPERDILKNRLFKPAPTQQFEAGSVGPNPLQEGASRATGEMLGQSRPLYSTGVGTLQRTAAGGYLDPSQTDPYRRLEATTRGVAKDLFSDLSGQIAGRAAGRGNFYSSARQNQQNEQARRVTSQTEQDLASRLFGQYGQERQLQQQAAGLGANLSPALAAQQFTQGTSMRDQDMEERAFQLRAFLANQGLDQREIENMMQYLRLTQPETMGPIVGPSPVAQASDYVRTGAAAASAAADVAKLFA